MSINDQQIACEENPVAPSGQKKPEILVAYINAGEHNAGLEIWEPSCKERKWDLN